MFLQISLFALNITKASLANLPIFHPADSILNDTLAVDVACQSEAELSELSGTFVALVSSPRRSLKQLLQYQYKDNIPIVNTKVYILLYLVLAIQYDHLLFL